MYHGICDAAGERHPYFETSTSPRIFVEQMQFLHDNGYNTTDLAGALTSLEMRNDDSKQVVITFDDAYHDFYTDAFPILLKHGFCATLFVITDFAKKQRVRRSETEYMTWDEIREVRSRGIYIGSHTITHPELQTLSAKQVKYELGKSKEVIEEEVGEPIRSFSYPYAFPEQEKKFVAHIRQTLGGCGYENGVSTMIGTATLQHDRLFLPRLPINSYDDIRLFQAKLEGGYDWLHTPQRLYKKLFKRSGSVDRFADVGSS